MRGEGRRGRGWEKSDQMTENKADEKINPVAIDETETEEERDDGDFRTGGRGENGKKAGGDGVKETGADMLSPGVLRVLLIHNSPPWQTFIHILTPHGCAQWTSCPSTSPCLSMDTPVAQRSVSPSPADASFFTFETVTVFVCYASFDTSTFFFVLF